ncbi:ABC transporter substrate-binding protein [Halobacteriovorax sp. HLS]|uniref:substrate-binding periplasmic protein n=1 Tax=Halobacteriovorax sp. HLS TaxID=2234000 RepID=UPI000FDA03F1|nr:transporter substrate-binding domain-containing protein [Halobacteriovorax sp. HLS]
MKLFSILLLIVACPLTLGAELTATGHPDYPPIAWESGGSLKGASVELVKAALKNLGHTVRFVPVGTWGRAQEEVKSGRIDILLPPYKTPKRELVYTFPERPFLMDKTAIFTKKGKVIKFNEFKDLKQFDGVAIVNDSFGDKFDKADNDHKILKRLSKTEQCLQFLLRGRADYLIAGQNAALAVISKLGLKDKFDIQEQLIIETGMYTAISKKSVYNTKKFTESFFKEMDRLVSEKLHEKAIADALDDYSNETQEDI